MFMKVPPSPLPPSNGGNSMKTHAQCFSSQGSKSYIVWRQTEREGGGGVVVFNAILSVFFCLLDKRDIL